MRSTSLREVTITIDLDGTPSILCLVNIFNDESTSHLSVRTLRQSSAIHDGHRSFGGELAMVCVEPILTKNILKDSVAIVMWICKLRIRFHLDKNRNATQQLIGCIAPSLVITLLVLTIAMILVPSLR